MSSFPGKFKEYDFISIDRFNYDNLSSSLFFLSHCHEDHMIGLNDPAFFACLQKQNYKLYCHEITAAFLLTDARYSSLRSHISALKANETYVIDIPSSSCSSDDVANTISVTLLPAYHCPGSVMFLIEGANGNILYTGDFRLSLNDVAQISHLKCTSGIVKEIDGLYLDTTFLNKEAMILPSREESAAAVVAEAMEWLARSESHRVFLLSASKYGHEYLLAELYKTLKQQIHVSAARMDAYKGVPDLLKCVTSDPKSTSIHSCIQWGIGKEPIEDETTSNPRVKRLRGKSLTANCTHCPEFSIDDPLVLTIKPSVMHFYTTHNNNVIEWVSKNYLRVCYSMHSSYSELKDFVLHVKPKSIHANVVPYGSSRQVVLKLLEDILSLVQHADSKINKSSSNVSELLPTKHKFINCGRHGNIGHLRPLLSNYEDILRSPSPSPAKGKNNLD
jgi:DNA cross-link repair 1C protein